MSSEPDYIAPPSPLNVAGKERAEVREAAVDIVDVWQPFVLNLTVGVVLCPGRQAGRCDEYK